MLRNKTLRIAVLTASLGAMALTGLARAADDTTTPPKTDAPATPPPRRGNFNPADMIKNYRDQFEGLNLTDDQMKKIDGFVETAEKEIKANAGSEDQDARRQSFTALRKLGEDVQSVLTETQKTALSAKRRQMMFTRFKESYTAASLNLTSDQTTKVNGIFDDAKKQLDAISPTDEEARNKSREIMRSTRDKLNGVLTPEQQKQIPQFGGRRGNRPTTRPSANPA